MMSKSHDFDNNSMHTSKQYESSNLIVTNKNNAENIYGDTNTPSLMNNDDSVGVQQNGINIAQFHSSINPKLNKDFHYYVLSRSWYAKWELSYRNRNPNSYKPEPIDNSDILDPNNKYLLRANVKQNRLIYLNEESWEKLHNLCSMVSDQLPIRRKAIEASLDHSLVILELHPCFVKFCVDSNPTSVVGVVISKSEPLSILSNTAHQLLPIEHLRHISLWLIDNAGLSSRKIEPSDNTRLSSLLQPGDRVVPSAALTVVITDNDQPPNNGIRAVSIVIDNSWKPTVSTPQPSSLPNVSITSPYNKSKSHIAGNVGLQNLGNTCYMNSAIQCLSHAVCLTNYFLNDKYYSEINEMNPLGANGNLARAYGNLIKKLWQPNHSSVWPCCAPNEMKHTIGEFSSQFSGYSQQDSQEFLVTLLDGLHEDLNRVRRKPYIELSDVTNKPVDEGAQLAWNVHKARNDSIIVDNFHGQLRSTIQCPSCHTVSVTFDPFVCLSLPLPSTADVKIIVSVTPYNIRKTVRIYKFKAPIGCSTRSIVDFVKDRVGLVHDNYFVHPQYSSTVVPLCVFATLNIDLKSLNIIDLFEFDPSLNVGELDSVNGLGLNNICRWALIRHNVPSPDSLDNRLFPNSMLVPLPHDFVAGVSSPANAQIIYNAVVSRLRVFLDKSKDVGAFNCFSSTNDNVQFKNENNDHQPLINILNLLERNDLFTVAKTKYQGFHESSRESQHQSDNPIIVDLNWNQEYNSALFSMRAPYECESSDCSSGSTSVWDHINSESTKDGFGAKEDYTLQHCLDSFLTKETLSYNNSWFCPKCETNQFASKKFDIYKLPRILIIHLKRFSYNRIIRGKITKHIVFPVDCLDMSPYVLNKNHSNPNKYSLFAVSRHIGSLSGGHYTAYAKNNLNNKWYHFDDSSVSEIHHMKFLAEDAYLLMYQLADSE